MLYLRHVLVTSASGLAAKHCFVSSATQLRSLGPNGLNQCTATGRSRNEDRRKQSHVSGPLPDRATARACAGPLHLPRACVCNVDTTFKFGEKALGKGYLESCYCSQAAGRRSESCTRKPMALSFSSTGAYPRSASFSSSHKRPQAVCRTAS